MITLNKEKEFRKFYNLISAALEKEIRPNQPKYFGKDIIMYTYESSEVKYMIAVDENREIHIRTYGTYRFDGLMDFIYKIETERGRPIHYGKNNATPSSSPSP